MTATSSKTRLAEAELSLKEHKGRLGDMHQEAEALDERGSSFWLCTTVPDAAEQGDNGVETSLPQLTSVCQVVASLKALDGSKHSWVYTAQIRSV